MTLTAHAWINHRGDVSEVPLAGDLVCSVVDWTMTPVPGTLCAAEELEIRDGRIVRGELLYDAEELRKAMAQGTTGSRRIKPPGRRAAR